jgi:hypothetical protein
MVRGTLSPSTKITFAVYHHRQSRWRSDKLFKLCTFECPCELLAETKDVVEEKSCEIFREFYKIG